MSNNYFTNPTDAMIATFGYGADLSDVTLAEIKDAFIAAGYSPEDAEELAHDFDGAILPPKARFV